MKRKLLLLLVLTTTLFGCQPVNKYEEKDQKIANRTVVAYMMGDVNLWDYILQSINKLEAGWNDSIDGHLLVYLDCSHHATQFRTPVLLEICHDTTDKIVSRVVKAYPDQDPADPKVMRAVLNDVNTLYPANSQGLIIAGHGSGWKPKNEYQPHPAPSKSISGAERYGTSIDIDELATALPVKYDFILFHACMMSNIESIYQLRNNCNYIMAPIVPLVDIAYPYEIITPYFFTKPHADLHKAAELSYKFYEENPSLLGSENDPYAVFTVAVTNTSKVEALAKATSELLSTIDMTNSEITKNLIAKDALGYLPFVNTVGSRQMFYRDLRNLHLFSTNADARKKFFYALYQAVIINYCTGNNKELLGKLTHPSTGTGGLSFYIPLEGMTEINTVFSTRFQWSKASGLDQRK